MKRSITSAMLISTLPVLGACVSESELDESTVSVDQAGVVKKLKLKDLKFVDLGKKLLAKGKLEGLDTCDKDDCDKDKCDKDDHGYMDADGYMEVDDHTDDGKADKKKNKKNKKKNKKDKKDKNDKDDKDDKDDKCDDGKCDKDDDDKCDDGKCDKDDDDKCDKDDDDKCDKDDDDDKDKCKHKKVRITLEAEGIAKVSCKNPGGNYPPGHNPKWVKVEVSGKERYPAWKIDKHGKLDFSVKTDSPDVDDVCPNKKWTAEVEDVKFTEAKLIIEQGNKDLIVVCDFKKPTHDGPVSEHDVHCKKYD